MDTTKLKDFGLNVLDILINVIVIVVLVYFVRSYIIAPFQVYGPSMCDTLNSYDGNCHNEFGEYIIINKAIYLGIIGEPQRGDVIVFKPPIEKDDYYIKRIIGVPGDTIEIEGGKLYLTNEENPDGVELSEPYLSERNAGHTATYGNSEFEVPEEHYLVMGDNREKSTDSRSCFTDPFSGGCGRDDTTPFLPEENITGKAWIVLHPFNRVRAIE